MRAKPWTLSFFGLGATSTAAWLSLSFGHNPCRCVVDTYPHPCHISIHRNQIQSPWRHRWHILRNVGTDFYHAQWEYPRRLSCEQHLLSILKLILATLKIIVEDPEGGDNRFLRNVDAFLPDYIVLHFRRW